VDVDVRPHLDLFDLDGLLLLAGLSGLFLALVLEAAVVEDLGDRRLRIGGDFDEVEARFPGQFEGARYGRRPVIGALAVDQLDLADVDVLIDARPILGGRGCLVRSANGGVLLCRCGVFRSGSRRRPGTVQKESVKAGAKSTAPAGPVYRPVSKAL
jgi:hypothetical protein